MERVGLQQACSHRPTITGPAVCGRQPGCGQLSSGGDGVDFSLDCSRIEISGRFAEFRLEREAERAGNLNSVTGALPGKVTRLPLVDQNAEGQGFLVRPRLRLLDRLLAFDGGVSPLARSPRMALAASLALANEIAEQEPKGTRRFSPACRYWTRKDFPPLAVMRTPRPDCSSSNTIISRRPAGHSKVSILRCVSFICRPYCWVRGPAADPSSGPALSRRVALCQLV